MPRRILAALLVLFLLAGGLWADVTGTVVSYDKGKLVVKVGEKEQTFDLGSKVHVHAANGDEIKLADRGKHLKKGVKVEIEEKEGKIVEVNIKK
jgi:hypothetical protein